MRKHFKKLKNQKGMTLVELLAVLVILGIIAAIAVPMIGNTIQDSRDKAAVNEALSIISAAKLAEANGDNTGSFDQAALESKNLIDLEESAFTSVSKNEDGVWSIEGHSANTVISTDPATEQNLLDFLEGTNTVSSHEG